MTPSISENRHSGIHPRREALNLHEQQIAEGSMALLRQNPDLHGPRRDVYRTAHA